MSSTSVPSHPTPPAALLTAPWYKHRWPWILMSGPLIVVVAASFSGWLAFTRQDALVADDYYKQGTAINQDLRRETAASTLGLSLDMAYVPQNKTLHGDLLSFGHPGSGEFTIRLAHASDPDKDIVVKAIPDATGHFDITMPGFTASWWKVTVEGANHQWRLNGEWKWPQEPTIKMAADLAPAD